MESNTPGSQFVSASRIRREIEDAGGLDKWFEQAHSGNSRGLALDCLVILGDPDGDEKLLEWLRFHALRILRYRFSNIEASTLEDAVQQALFDYTSDAEWRAQFVEFVFNGLADGHTNCAVRFFNKKALMCVRNEIRVPRTAQGQQRFVSLDAVSDGESEKPRIEKVEAPGASPLDVVIDNEAREQFRALAPRRFSKLNPAQQEILILFAFGMNRHSAAEFLGVPVERVDVGLSQARSAFLAAFEGVCRDSKGSARS